MNVVWRIIAEQQLLAQLAFVRVEDPYAAGRLALRIDERIRQLSLFPLSGRPTRRPGLRELVISGTPYIAVYEVKTGEIEIVRFFHASQNR